MIESDLQIGANAPDHEISQTECNYQASELPSNNYGNGFFNDRPTSPKSTHTRPHIELTDVDSMVDMVFQARKKPKARGKKNANEEKIAKSF